MARFLRRRWRSRRRKVVRVQMETLVELVQQHREQWPLARVGADPQGFRAQCAQLLAVFAAEASVGGQWLDLMFAEPKPDADGDRAEVREHAIGCQR
ncbi:MAG: hypothetical protein ACM3YM_02875 [Sphingomonadales bacterium]